MSDNVVKVIETVWSELDRATEKFPPMRSAHEALAIIEEEFLELREAIFWGSPANAVEEATQLAAMAIRFLIDREHYGDTA
jgi:hypothetical protein